MRVDSYLAGRPHRAVPSSGRATGPPCRDQYPANSGVLCFSFRAGVLLLSTLSVLSAQAVHPPPEIPASLSTVSVPQPPPSKLANYVKDVSNQSALVALGKALFWDMQVGSDGVQACASCHYNAGADSRFINQVNPGSDNVFNSVSGPNQALTAASFPIVTNDRVSSQGVYPRAFVDINPDGGPDIAGTPTDSVFKLGDLLVRRVAGRNAPTVINAAFNHRNFWDGRASHFFNGRNPFGDLVPSFVIQQTNNQATPKTVRLENSSLASQAIGPPPNAFEMGSIELFWQKIGKRMLPRVALALQRVAADDSVLGPYARPDKGLKLTYEDLIRQVFRPEFLDSKFYFTCSTNCDKWQFINRQPLPKRPLTTNEYTIIEFNFPLFFGLAIQAYEEQLISTQSKFDQYREGAASLAAEELNGLDVFMGKGKCIACHQGAEFTSASVSHIQQENVIERMYLNPLDPSSIRTYDNGFYRLGQQSKREDIGVGDVAPRTGNPLSFSRSFLDGNLSFQIDACKFEAPFSISVPPYVLPASLPTPLCSFIPPVSDLRKNEQLSVDGAFKTASLRNVELTAPYFHNGSLLTLDDVVQFYNNGGGASGAEHPDITVLGLSSEEVANVVAFLKTLTDERVRTEKAPFDHPAICIPHGQGPNSSGSELQTNLVYLEAVGRTGGSPIATFNDLLAGATAGKTHTLAFPNGCSISNGVVSVPTAP
jgi:cytochrome c peroxidase